MYNSVFVSFSIVAILQKKIDDIDCLNHIFNFDDHNNVNSEIRVVRA